MLRMEYLEEGSDDCPLIRIYGTEAAGYSSLRHEIHCLSEEAERTCRLHQLPGVLAFSNCTLTMSSSTNDEGVRQVGRGFDFTWRLSPAKWFIVAGLIEPFAGKIPLGVFQWLSGNEARHGLDMGKISVLISYSRTGSW